MEEKELLSRFVGSFLGLAIGDALGAPVEFMSREDILSAHGEKGIRDFLPWRGFPAGSYTDDTQMSMATAVGCIRSHQHELAMGTADLETQLWRSYREWRRTQSDPAQTRAPGSTCLAVLRSKYRGTTEEPVNNSKGCGGVMRTAPLGMVFPAPLAFRHGVMAAALTHGNPAGYLPAGLLSAIIAFLVRGLDVRDSVRQSLGMLEAQQDGEDTHRAVNQAVVLAGSNMNEQEAIERLGLGWVGDEAIAVSTYCALKHQTSFADGVLAAVNHSGDSDSTGSITGAILGAHLGIGGLPRSWIDEVENAAGLKKLARDLLLACVRGDELSFEEYSVE